MTHRPEHLRVQKTLFAIRRLSDARDIAYVEAQDEAQASRRAAYLIGQMNLLGWEEVNVVAIELAQGAAPTFFESFFLHWSLNAGQN